MTEGVMPHVWASLILTAGFLVIAIVIRIRRI